MDRWTDKKRDLPKRQMDRQANTNRYIQTDLTFKFTDIPIDR
jgi:hypothetical protein